MRARIQLTLTLVLLASPAIAQPVWTSLYGPEVGDVICFYNDSTHLYAGTRNGGLFVTRLESANWSLLGFSGHTISAIAVDTAGRLFVASYDSGVYVMCGDSSWIRRSNGLSNIKTTHLDISPISQTLFLRGTRNYPEYAKYFRSTNAGETWVSIDSGLTTGNKYLCVTSNGNLLSAKSLNSTHTLIYRSTNEGLDWEVTDSLPALLYPPTLRKNGQNICIFSPYSNSVCMYYSRDNGENWERIPCTFVLQDAQINSRGELYVSESPGGYRFSIRRWTDSSWVMQQEVNEEPDGDCFRFVEHLNRIFVANGVEIFRINTLQSSYDDFTNGLTAPEVNSIAITDDYILCTYMSRIYEEHHYGGVFRYYPTYPVGYRWQRISSSEFPIVAYQNGVAVGGCSSGFYYSTDQGRDWELSTTIPIEWYRLPLLAKAPDNNMYCSGGRDVYRSTNNGRSWALIRQTNGIITSLCTMPSRDSLHWYVAIGGQTDWGRMNEDGSNWLSGYGGGLREVTQIFTGKHFGTDNHDIYTSIDSGLSWQLNSHHNEVYAIASNSSGSVFAATDTGLIASTDLGESWFSFQGSLGAIRVIELQVDSNDVLYAGTRSNGIFWTCTPVVAVAEKPESPTCNYQLSKNYPNPFNASTTISYSLPAPEKVELKLYDLTGREVRSLVNRWQPAGSHTYTLNGDALSSGIYFLRLKTAAYQKTQRIVLLK